MTTAAVAAGPATRALRRYLDRIDAATTRDPLVTEVYARTIGMLERPTALFRPRVVAAAVRAGQAPARPAAPPGRVSAPRTSADQQQEVRRRHPPRPASRR
jgi:hypothetical protein